MPTFRHPSVRLVLVTLCLATTFAAGSARAGGAHDTAAAEDSLRATEIAFAQTMADRDHAAFTTFLAEETVFFGRETTNRGRSAVAAAWKPYFEGPTAPFSWAPEAVAVLASGELGLTSGPIYDPEGKRIGTFNSVWRRDETGTWKVVFDRGCPPCACP